MSLNAGDRNRLVVFQRATVTTDAMGGEVKTWGNYVSAYADVSYGTGQERRAAVQEGGSQAATLRVLRNALTAALLITDRASFDGGLWDLTSIVPLGVNEGIEFTAVRAAS